jgi:zinc protease
MTTPDFTSFYATTPPEAVELAIRLEAARLRGVELTEPAFRTEQNFVQRERGALLASNPTGRAVERLFAAAYPNHGYGRPVLGSESDLAAITLEQTRSYYQDRYRPAHAILTVTGRFDAKAVSSAIRSSLGSVPKGDAVAKDAPVTPPAPTARASESFQGRLPMLLIGWRGPAGGDRSLASIGLIAGILGDPLAGRLARDLVGADKPFLQVRVGFDALQLGSLLYVYAILAPSTDAATAETALLNAVSRLAETPVEPDELAMAQGRAELVFRSEVQTARGRARAIGTGALVDGDPLAAWGRMQSQEAVTPALIQETARNLFRSENRSVVVLTTGSGTGGEREQP